MHRQPESPSRFYDLWAVALAVASVLLQGHRFGVGNQEWMIAAMRMAADADLLANDAFLRGGVPHTAHIAVLSRIASVFGESGAFLAAHLVTRLILMTGIWRLCAALVPRRRLAPLFAMIVVAFEPRIWIGGHFLQGGHYEGAFLGMAVAVWTLAMGARWIADGTSWRMAALSAGAGVLVHLFIGLPVLAIVLLAYLVHRRSRPGFDSVAPFLVLSLGIALPALIPAVTGFFLEGEKPLSDKLLIAVLEARHPHHHMPWTWPAREWAELAAVLATGAMLLRLAAARTALPTTLLVWYAATGALFWYCAEKMVAPSVVYFQSFRLLGLLLAVVACATGALCSRIVEVLPGLRGTMLVALCAVSFRFPFAFAVVAILIVATLPRQCTGMHGRHFAKRELHWLVAAAGLLAIGTLQLSPALRRAANTIRHEYWLAEVPVTPERTALAEWIRSETLPGDMLLVPMDAGDFRVVEERAIIVDLKYVPYRNAELAEWARRVLLSTGRLRVGEANSPAFDEAILAWREGSATQEVPLDERFRIAERYGANWVVVRGGEKGAGAAFESGPWSVYAAENRREP